MVFALNGTVTLTFDLVTSKYIGVIYWPWPIFLLSTMTVSHKLFKILSGHGVANGRTDGQTDGRTDERHTIIRSKFHFGRIKSETRGIFVKNSLLWDKAAKCTCLQKSYKTPCNDVITSISSQIRDVEGWNYMYAKFHKNRMTFNICRETFSGTLNKVFKL